MMTSLIEIGDAVSYSHPWDNEHHVGIVRKITALSFVIEEDPIGSHDFGDEPLRSISKDDLQHYHLKKITHDTRLDILEGHRKTCEMFGRVNAVDHPIHYIQFGEKMTPAIFKYDNNDQNTIRFDYIVSTCLDEGVNEGDRAYLVVKSVNHQIQLEGDDIERFFRQYNDWLKRG